MPKNKIGGSGAKKAAAKNAAQSSRLIPFKEDLQDYGIIQALLGSGRARVLCLTDKVERLGTIRGNMYKKVWINKDDVVLVSIREFQTDKCDIIFKYNPDEVKFLKKQNEIPKDLETINEVKDDDLIEFNNDSSSDKDLEEVEDEINIDDI
jgi:translation initiation factor 1A